MKISRTLMVVLIVLLSVAGTPVAHPLAAGPPPPWGAGDGSLLFVENVGQFDARARFQVRGGPATLWLAEDALWVTVMARPQTQLPRR
ncbi:MAG: hypothetical protein ACP5HM_12470 [Anaerolineae bacterium]